MFDNYDDILNVADVAKALKIGNTQAYKLVRSGKLPAFKEGRAWKISKQSLIVSECPFTSLRWIGFL